MALLMLGLFVSWRLSSGPVSLGFLTPYIETALNEVRPGALNITFDDTILTWAGWQRALDIRIENMRARLPSGELVAAIPEVSITLSAQALLKGVIAPQGIEFFGPKLKIVRKSDGKFDTGFQDASEGASSFLASMVLVMLQNSTPAYAMSYLQRINVVSGDVTYVDEALGTTWRAPKADASFTRAEGGLRADLSLRLQAGDKLADVSILGRYFARSKRVDLGVSFEDITPSVFAGLSDQVAVLGVLDVPLSGTLTMSVQQNGRIEGIGFDLSGKNGHVALPVALAERLGVLSWAQRVGVRALRLSGHYDGARRLLDITVFKLRAQKGARVYLAAPLNHEMPLRDLDLALHYAGESGRLDITQLNLDLGGPRVEAKVVAPNFMDVKSGSLNPAVSFDVSLAARNFPFNDVERLWPKSLIVNARQWVKDGLHDGVVDSVTLTATVRPAPGGGVRLTALKGKMHARGVRIDYLPPMAQVKNVSASATFDENRLDIAIEKGDVPDGMKISGGKIALYNLQADMPDADIQLDISGSLPAVLQLIDSEPLGFASDLGLQAEATRGAVAAHLRLRFPLKQDLLAQDVRAVAHARLSGAVIPNAMFGRDLRGGDLQLKVTNNALDVKGDAQLGGVPVQIVWRHNFKKDSLFLDHYELTGDLKDVLKLGAFGVRVPDVVSRHMRGALQADVSFTVLGDGRQALSARFDLADVALDVPALRWSKPAGVPATGTLELRLKNDVPREIPKLTMTAPDLNISGSATFAANGAFQRLNLDTMRLGRTNIMGSLTLAKSGIWEVVLRGQSLDASRLWNEMVGVGDVSPDSEDLQEDNLVINAALDIHSLILRKNKVLKDFIGTVYRDRGVWRKIDVAGSVGDRGSLELMLDSALNGLRYLSITSNNAGAALRTLDLYDNIIGGAFDLKAAYTRVRKNAPLEGVVKITDYALKNPPVFARLIGLMSLSGISDALQGKGLQFDILDAPFKLDKGLLTLTQARASGPSLGVTANGTVDMAQKTLNLQGTVVPAYAINALLGRIPLIGKLFRGMEKGGGLFAATYTMKGRQENAEIMINPLSVLAPGVLRDIFTGSSKERDVVREPIVPKVP